jgi:hypothetical protein
MAVSSQRGVQLAEQYRHGAMGRLAHALEGNHRFVLSCGWTHAKTLPTFRKSNIFEAIVLIT